MMRKINPHLERAETAAKVFLRAEDRRGIAGSTCAGWICLDIATFVPGKSVAAIGVKALLAKNLTCKVMGKIQSPSNFHRDQQQSAKPDSLIQKMHWKKEVFSCKGKQHHVVKKYGSFISSAVNSFNSVLCM